MSDEDLDLEEEIESDPEVEALEKEVTSNQVDSRRRLEDKLEEARLRKLMQDYDFD